MIGTVIKTPLLPSTIHFNHTMDNQTEVMRISRDGVWVNPEIEVDETAKSVLDALDSQIKVLLQAERNRIINLLMIQHEAAKVSHNYWQVAANLIKAEFLPEEKNT